MRDAGDRVRRETGNHYLFSTLSGKQWRLLNGDVGGLPLLKYANDVHGSGDAANAALIGGRLVALVRIRALDEVRWVYGWSQEMWREIIAGDGPAHPRRETQPRQTLLDGWLSSSSRHGVHKCSLPPNTLRISPPPCKCATLKTYVFTRLYCVNSYVSVYTHVNVCKLSDQRMLRVANGSKRFVANKAHLQRCTQTTLESD